MLQVAIIPLECVCQVSGAPCMREMPRKQHIALTLPCRASQTRKLYMQAPNRTLLENYIEIGVVKMRGIVKIFLFFALYFHLSVPIFFTALWVV